MENAKLTARGFTASAIHILEQLWPRAADRRMSDAVTEQSINMLTFWSLLHWERKVGLAALERMGVNLDSLRKAMDRVMVALCQAIREKAGPPEYQTLPSGQRAVVVDFDTPLEPLLTSAEAEALWMDHTYIGTEHLLLAIIRRSCPRLREVLQVHGITYVRAKTMVIELLRSAPPDAARPASK